MGIRGSDRQIDNIEFNVSDIARSKAFYGHFSALYRLRANLQRIQRRRLTGGFTTGSRCARGPLIILYADDLQATQQRVTAAGQYQPRDLCLPRWAAFPFH